MLATNLGRATPGGYTGVKDQVTQHRTVLELVCMHAVLVYHLPCTAFSSYQRLSGAWEISAS